MTPIMPRLDTPLIGPNGMISDTWYEFFASLIVDPPKITPVTPTGSPYSYIASMDGALSFTGGTGVSATLNRARVTVPVPANIITVNRGDAVTVTYSSAPAINFIPR